MKKLIEFQEDKHAEVIEVIAQFRADNNTTFSEAVRRLILCSRNGHCPTEEQECGESVQPGDFYQLQANMTERVETLEKKVEVLVKASKAFKNYMDRKDHNCISGTISGHSDEE